MPRWLLLMRRSLMMALLVGCWPLAVQAQVSFPAISRPALPVRQPERQFLLAAAQVGHRLVAVGERGLVLLSEDLGESWRQAARVPVSVTLTAVSFVNDRQGWAVGHGGTILATSDGGEHWFVQADGVSLAKAALSEAQGLGAGEPGGAADRALRSAQALLTDGPDKPLLDVHFENADRGWVVGAYNLFFETRDGGKTWLSARRLIDNPKEMHLYAIRSAGEQVYLLGEQGQMHRSDDGGRSFKALQSPYAGSWFTLATGVDGSLLAGGLRGHLFRSTDRGESWQQVPGVPPISLVSAAPLGAKGMLAANQAGQVFLVGAGGHLSLLHKSTVSALTGVLPLADGGLLVTGASGVERARVETLKKGQ